MAKYASMCKETTTTTGTGTLSLGGAVSGFRTILSPSNISSGNYVQYFLKDANGTGWERGFGVITSGTPDTLSRVKILESSASDAAITLSAGTHTVGIAPTPQLITGQLGAYYSHNTTQTITTGTINTLLNFNTTPTQHYDTDTLRSGSRLVMPAWADVAEVHFDYDQSAPATGSPTLIYFIVDYADNFHTRIFDCSFDGQYLDGGAAYSQIIRRSDATNPQMEIQVKANASGQTITVGGSIRMDIIA